jgi:hypothetical protein
VLAEFSVIQLFMLAEFSIIQLSVLATRLEPPFFLLHAANLINPANLICPSIHAVVWANLGNLANPANPANQICSSICAAVWANPGNLANPIYLPIHVVVLPNPVNPARVMLLRPANPVKPAVVT